MRNKSVWFFVLNFVFCIFFTLLISDCSHINFFSPKESIKRKITSQKSLSSEKSESKRMPKEKEAEKKANEKVKFTAIGLKGPATNYSKKVGRHDPFVPIDIVGDDDIPDIEIINKHPELYRLAGILIGKNKKVVVLEFGKNIYVAEEGEVIRGKNNTLEIREITKENVVLAKGKKTLNLVLSERYREQVEEVVIEKNKLEKLPDINILFQEYLQKKKEEEKKGKEISPDLKTFQGYVEEQEKLIK